MNCSKLFLIVFAGVLLPEIAGAKTPVVAQKPTPKGAVSGCEECRFLMRPSRSTPILPIQGGPHLPPVEDMPGPLPHALDFKQIPNSAHHSGLSDLVNEFLPNLSAEEQRVWVDELKSLPPEIARDLLSARSQFGSPQSLPEETPGGLVPPPEQSEPIPELEGILRRVPHDASWSKATNTLPTLETLKQVEAILVHNIANANSYGYKRLMPLTHESRIAGVEGISVRRVERTGTLEKTGGTWDLAINGPGLFQVRLGDTVALTRCGAFQISNDRHIVIDAAGEQWSLFPPIEIPAETTETVVHPDGSVACHLAGEEDAVVVGQIELASVSDFSLLETAGSGLLGVPETAEPVIVGRPGDSKFGRIHQGVLERSNVVLSAEIAALKRVRLQISTLDEQGPPQIALPESDAVR